MRVLGRVTFVQGGFSPIGGIESFAVDLLSVIDNHQVQAELICWDAGSADRNPMLVSLSKSNIAIFCSKWRWGCCWGWPDKWMASRFWKRMMDAEVLVFGKLLHSSILSRLSEARKRMILITPYRPAEMWKDCPPDHDILNSFEMIVVQAQAFENDLRSFRYDGRVVTLPYLPPKTQRPTAWPTAPTLQIGFLGRLVPDKNLEYLICSISQLCEMGVKTQLHLFGDGSERGALMSLADRLGLSDHIIFHGELDRDRIPEAIDACHLFAFSSITEGQCLAALEILARGRPVLATPVGAFPEFLSGLLGSIAPLGCPTAFASALKALAGPVLNGEITPEKVQRAYQIRFPRCQIIKEYMRILSASYQ
jgi:glycosyltransferase involved in cell wall biosynthesis